MSIGVFNMLLIDDFVINFVHDDFLWENFILLKCDENQINQINDYIDYELDKIENIKHFIGNYDTIKVFNDILGDNFMSNLISKKDFLNNKREIKDECNRVKEIINDILKGSTSGYIKKDYDIEIILKPSVSGMSVYYKNWYSSDSVYITRAYIYINPEIESLKNMSMFNDKIERLLFINLFQNVLKCLGLRKVNNKLGWNKMLSKDGKWYIGESGVKNYRAMFNLSEIYRIPMVEMSYLSNSVVYYIEDIPREREIMYPGLDFEIMSQINTSPKYLTFITLGILEDLGYNVNYSSKYVINKNMFQINFDMEDYKFVDSVFKSILEDRLLKIKKIIEDIILHSKNGNIIIKCIEHYGSNSIYSKDSKLYINPNYYKTSVYDNIVKINDRETDKLFLRLLRSVLMLLMNQWNNYIDKDHYIGPRYSKALDEYNRLFGLSKEEFSFIPLENTISSLNNKVWDNSDRIINGKIYPNLSDEVFSAYTSNNYLTSITVGALDDNGIYRVNYDSEYINNNIIIDNRYKININMRTYTYFLFNQIYDRKEDIKSYIVSHTNFNSFSDYASSLGYPIILTRSDVNEIFEEYYNRLGDKTNFYNVYLKDVDKNKSLYDKRKDYVYKIALEARNILSSIFLKNDYDNTFNISFRIFENGLSGLSRLNNYIILGDRSYPKNSEIEISLTKDILYWRLDKLNNSNKRIPKLLTLIIHEMLHGFGFSYKENIDNYGWKNYLENKEWYVKEGAVLENYRKITNDDSMERVPVENNNSSVTAYHHWDEGLEGNRYFDGNKYPLIPNDIMTGYLSNNSNVLFTKMTASVFVDYPYSINMKSNFLIDYNVGGFIKKVKVYGNSIFVNYIGSKSDTDWIGIIENDTIISWDVCRKENGKILFLNLPNGKYNIGFYKNNTKNLYDMEYSYEIYNPKIKTIHLENDVLIDNDILLIK